MNTFLLDCPISMKRISLHDKIIKMRSKGKNFHRPFIFVPFVRRLSDFPQSRPIVSWRALLNLLKLLVVNFSQEANSSRSFLTTNITEPQILIRIYFCLFYYCFLMVKSIVVFKCIIHSTYYPFYVSLVNISIFTSAFE